ncbi:hypothetical protein D039_0072B, partial [Vibrio parahaemolyticus EKP-028]
QQHVGQSL